ncbi:MAG TPA: hypothetical protein VNI78_03440, partial [Vicinamibacterales bacterium]|nr:hypothetical protein [Vicinamibacterales bacterium]
LIIARCGARLEELPRRLARNRVEAGAVGLVLGGRGRRGEAGERKNRKNSGAKHLHHGAQEDDSYRWT